MKQFPLFPAAIPFVALLGAGHAFSTTCSAAQAADAIRISADTTQFLADVDGYRKKSGQAGKAAAASLNKRADGLYKQKKYDAANKLYWASPANFSNVHGYIMTGDTHLRGVIKFQQKSSADQNGCKIDNQDFVHRLELDISNHYERGLALAEKDNDQAMLQSDFYKRAYRSAVCLQALADFYKTRPKTECIDIAKIAACLGEPLLK